MRWNLTLPTEPTHRFTGWLLWVFFVLGLCLWSIKCSGLCWVIRCDMDADYSVSCCKALPQSSFLNNVYPCFGQVLLWLSLLWVLLWFKRWHPLFTFVKFFNFLFEVFFYSKVWSTLSNILMRALAQWKALQLLRQQSVAEISSSLSYCHLHNLSILSHNCAPHNSSITFLFSKLDFYNRF